MSHSHSQPSDDPAAHVGTTGMNLKKIILVGVGSLVIFAVGIIWAYFLMVGQRKEIDEAGRAAPPKELGKPEIGIVDQVLFSHDNRLELWKAERAKKLSSYGWVDRAKGVAHMPIEQAMQKVIASPPDIAGEGVPPAAALAPPPPPAPAEQEGKEEPKKEKAGHKAKGGDKADKAEKSEKAGKAEKAGGAP